MTALFSHGPTRDSFLLQLYVVIYVVKTSIDRNKEKLQHIARTCTLRVINLLD